MSYHFIPAEPGWIMIDHIASDMEVPVIGWKLHTGDDYELNQPVVAWPTGPGGPSFNNQEDGSNYTVYHPIHHPLDEVEKKKALS